ncbi:RidA family protein [Bosea vaviloviae]|nr:RidA family protein [Bosea vaviloviae]
MTHTANFAAPGPGKFRRILAAAWAFLQAMESTNFDYTLDRIERLEGEVARLKEELRQSHDPSPSVSRHNPPTMWNMASGKFSQISVAEQGRLAFLSGQIAAAPGSQDTPKDIAGQAKLATASLAAALDDLEASAQDIVMMRVYVVNATTEAFQQVLTALLELLGDAMPSMRTIGVQALYTPEILVEIEMVVRLPAVAASKFVE